MVPVSHIRMSSTRIIAIAALVVIVLLFQTKPTLGLSDEQQMVFSDPVNITNTIGVYDTLPSLALDAQGNPHVVYMGTYPSIGAPDNVTTDIFYTHAVNGVFTAPEKISVPDGYYSKNPTVAVDSQDVVHVVFMRSEDQIFSEPEDDIYYANNQTGSFNTITKLVDGYFGFSDEKPFSSTDSPIILADEHDNLHVAFRASDERLSTSFRQIFYTNNIGGAFNPPALVSDGVEYVNNYVMDLDSLEQPHFAYEANATVYYVKALQIQPSAAQFSTPVQAALIPRTVQDFFPGLAVDSSGTAHITFRDTYPPTFHDYELLYTNNSSGSFSAPQDVSLEGFTSTIELDEQDNPHVLYKRLGGQLAYANNLSGSFEHWDLPGNISHTGVNYFKISPDGRFHVVYYFWRYIGSEVEYDIYYIEGQWQTIPDNSQTFIPLLQK